VKGVALLAKTGARRGRVTVSLDGLEAGKSYAVGWSTKACAKPESPPSAQSSVLMETVTMTAEFITRPIALSGSPAAVRSVRIWDKEHVLSCTATSRRAVNVGMLNGTIKGAVAVIAAGNEGNAHAYVSLSGLEVDTDYRVVGSTRACSRPYTPGSRMFGSVPDLHTAAHEAFLALSLNFEKYKTTDLKSYRVLTRTPGGPVKQAACIKGSVVNIN
jgi:hypothetical protein